MVRQREQGHTIHIVTHRNDFGAKGIRSTCEWLSRWCVPYDTLSFAKDKTSVPVDVFIEDNVDNVLALQSAGVVAVLMTRSWNENDQKAEHLLRVGSFVEFQRLVDRVQKLRDREAVPVEPRGSTEARSDIVLPDTGRGRLLAEAARITHGDRNLSYGSPTQNFTDIASVWNVQFRHKLSEGQSFVPADIARAMVGMKLVRMIAADKFDNWLDIAGYAGCGWEALEEEQAAQKTV